MHTSSCFQSDHSNQTINKVVLLFCRRLHWLCHSQLHCILGKLLLPEQVFYMLPSCGSATCHMLGRQLLTILPSSCVHVQITFFFVEYSVSSCLVPFAILSLGPMTAALQDSLNLFAILRALHARAGHCSWAARIRHCRQWGGMACAGHQGTQFMSPLITCMPSWLSCYIPIASGSGGMCCCVLHTDCRDQRRCLRARGRPKHGSGGPDPRLQHPDQRKLQHLLSQRGVAPVPSRLRSTSLTCCTEHAKTQSIMPRACIRLPCAV